MLELINVSKDFRQGKKNKQVLKPTNLRIEKSEFVAILGPSGSGKSTLLTIMGALQKASKGQVLFDGKDLLSMTEKEINNFRFYDLGFILQSSNLVPYLSIKEQFILKSRKAKLKNSQERIDDLMKKLSIDHIQDLYPQEVSGGERQRTAISLALLLQPQLILADEPTASLDTEKAFEVVELLRDVVKREKTSIVMVTHDQRVLSSCDRVYQMTDGYLKAS